MGNICTNNGNGKSKDWVDSVISGEIKERRPYYRDVFCVIVLNGEMTVSARSRVYRIEQENNLYKGEAFKSVIVFWLKEGVMYLRDGNDTKQFRYDTSYTQTEEVVILSKPENIEISNENQIIEGTSYVTFQWNYVSTAGSVGACGQLKKAGSEEYETVKIDVVYMNVHVIQINKSYLLEGENFVRLYHIGGPDITNKKEVYLTKDSIPSYFKITVDSEGNIEIEQIN